MKKIILFGATGNVGSYVLKYALEFFNSDEYEIIASGRRETDFFSSMNVKYISADITKEEDIDRLPKEDVYAVILLSAMIPSYMKEYDPEIYLKTNVMGTYHVLEYCRKIKADRILFSTTVFDLGEYKKINGITLYPNMPRRFSYTGDHAVYVISKNSATELLEHYHQEYGIRTFIFRFPNIYCYSPNPYYYPNGIRTVRPIFRMICQAIAGEDIEIWGDPYYEKNLTYVYDCAQLLCKAICADIDGGIYNVGTGIPVTLKEQIETIIDVFSPADKRSGIIYRPDKRSGGGSLMNIDKARKNLGYEPVYDCRRMFEDIKKEMEINRFIELRD